MEKIGNVSGAGGTGEIPCKVKSWQVGIAVDTSESLLPLELLLYEQALPRKEQVHDLSAGEKHPSGFISAESADGNYGLRD